MKVNTNKLHIMSVLGTGNYKPVFYENKEGEPDKYVQNAIVRKFCEPNIEVKVTIYMTDSAKEIHGEALRTALHTEFPGAVLNAVRIPDGKNQDEIMEIFEIIYDQIEKDDEIVFDVTHSFRSIPLIIVAVLQYARVLKECTLKGIYYGAYEAKNEEDVAPIINLSLFNNIIEWTFAAEQFSKYGNATPMSEVFADNGMIVGSMVNLADCIAMNRGSLVGDKNTKKVAQTSIKIAFDNFESADLTTINQTGEKPLVELIEYAKRRYATLSHDKDYEVGMAVVRLCIDFNMISQGYTALDETIKTYVCEANGMDCNAKYCREDIASVVIGAKGAYMSMKNMDVDDTEAMWAFFIKENKKSKDIYDDADEEKRKLIRKVFEFVDRDLVRLQSNIADYRNDINHFGYRPNPLAVSVLKRKLETLYKQAEEIMNYDE